MATVRNENVQNVVCAVQETVEKVFGKSVSVDLALALSKELGLVVGLRGRTGGTHTTPAGLALLNPDAKSE